MCVIVDPCLSLDYISLIFNQVKKGCTIFAN